MTSEELKHLDYVQGMISRFATNQFQIKSWCITIMAAILTLFANSFNNTYGLSYRMLLVGVFPTTMFWILDSKFLSSERKLRQIYDDILNHKEIKPLEIPIKKYRGGRFRLISCMFSYSNFILYFVVDVGLIAGYTVCKMLASK